MNLMEINNLDKSFGGLSALLDFNFRIAENELVGLIGPNGAGKTTVFNLITGVYKPDRGSIMFRGKTWPGWLLHHLCQGCGQDFSEYTSFQ